MSPSLSEKDNLANIFWLLLCPLLECVLSRLQAGLSFYSLFCQSRNTLNILVQNQALVHVLLRQPA